MKILNPKIDLKDFFANLTRKTHLLLMLDYDGTLAPFTIDRMKAYPYHGVQEHLQELLHFPQIRIVIVSGRSLFDLRKLLHLNPEPEMWGSHGLERKTAVGEYFKTEVNEKNRAGLELASKLCLLHVEAQQCEIKPYSVALHWRGMNDNSRREVESLVKEEWKKVSFEHGLEVHAFDGGLEMRLKGANKGNVIRTLLKETSSATKILYLGDDVTDEEAFAVLKDKGLKAYLCAKFHGRL